MALPTSRKLLPVAVLLLATIPFVSGLRNGFTLDDVALAAENPRIRDGARLSEAFTTDWWNGQRPHSLLYRPLTMASFAIDYAAARHGEAGPPPARLPARDAFPFHVQSLLWHGAASVALFLLVFEMFASPGLALATAAIFAVHPVHTEAVYGIVGRAELMSASFAFVSLLFAWRVVRDDPQGAARPALAGAFLLAALLSKESAIVIPAVPLFWVLLRDPAERSTLLARSSFRRLLASLGVAALAYLAIRTAVLGSPVAPSPTAPGTIVVDNPIAGAGGIARLLTPLRVFGETLRVIVYPRTLSADYSYDQLPLVRSLDGATAASALALAGLVAAVFLLRRRAPAASFGVFFFLLAWGLTSNLPVVIGTIFGERLFYLPSAGACLAIASVLTYAAARVPARGLAAAAIGVLVLVGGARTWARAADWKDNAALFASAAAASPRSCKALDGYASELFTAGRPRDAIAWAQRALNVYPDFPGAHQTLAKSLRIMANEEADPAQKAELRGRAAAHARKLLELYAGSAGGGRGLADAWNVMGSLALDADDAEGALTDFEKSLASDPAFVPSIVGSGVALARRGDRDGALKRFEQAQALDPGNADARGNAAEMHRLLAGEPAAQANLHGVRGMQLFEEKRLAESLAEFREAARLQPQAARAYLGIGTVLAAQSDAETDANRKRAYVDEAISAFTHALELEPDNADAHRNLGIIYLGQRRDPKKVAEHFRAYLRLVPGSPQRAQMEETIRQMDARSP